MYTAIVMFIIVQYWKVVVFFLPADNFHISQILILFIAKTKNNYLL